MWNWNWYWYPVCILWHLLNWIIYKHQILHLSLSLTPLLWVAQFPAKLEVPLPRAAAYPVCRIYSSSLISFRRSTYPQAITTLRILKENGNKTGIVCTKSVSKSAFTGISIKGPKTTWPFPGGTLLSDFSSNLPEPIISFSRNVIFVKPLLCYSPRRSILTLLNDIYPIRSANSVS